MSEELGRLLSGPLGAEELEQLKTLLRTVGELPSIKTAIERVKSDPKRGYARVPLDLFKGERSEVVLVVLQPGERIRPHDHGVLSLKTEDEDDPALGLVHVICGSEQNSFYELREPGGELELVDTRSIAAGEFLVLTQRIIHSIENVGEGVAASIHAYQFAQEDAATQKRRYH